MTDIRELLNFIAKESGGEPHKLASDELPHYASIDSKDGSTLVAAVCKSNYISSIMKNSEVQSFLKTPGDTQEVVLVRCRSIQESLSRGNKSARDSSSKEETKSSEAPNTTESQPKQGNRLPSSRPAPDESIAPYNLRDPNAPPGFEYETYPSREPAPELRQQFDPDQDLYPPGGRYPSLGPMAAGSRIGPFQPSRSGGMHPEPLGQNKPPRIRYDPTSPFSHPPSGPDFGAPPF